MPFVSILVTAWLLMIPASGAVSFQQQDSPGASPTESPASAPAGAPQAATTKSEPPAADKEASSEAAKKKTAGAPATKAKKRHRVRKRAPKPVLAGEPRRIVVREGGTTEPPARIVPGLTPEEARRQRQNAVELLNVTEENLKQLSGRTLDSRQQETVAQIHNYVEGARSALQDGDTQRAHTLALKAQLLADDLVKH